MLILRKKQIVFTTMCILLSIFTFMFTTAQKNETASSTKETVSLPVSRKNNTEFQMKELKVAMELQKQNLI